MLRRKIFRTKIIYFFLLTLLVRILFLGSDPSILLDSGQVGDEGYWIYNARYLALFGTLAPDEFFHDIAAGPIFTIFSYISFIIFEVGYWQSRLVSALAGFLTVIVTYQIARPLGTKVSFIAVTLLAFNTLLLLHNRLAVPESLSILFMVVTVYLWIKKFPIVSGIALTMAIFAKTTAFLFIPSILLIVITDFIFKKVSFANTVKFIAGFIISLAVLGIFLFLHWGAEIFSIYSTFGNWYSPRNIIDFWGSIIGFFLHPFWGSPFSFVLVTLALVNIVTMVFNKLKTSYTERVQIVWLVGALVLTPFMAQITNARLLPLLIPLSILAAMTLTNINYYFCNINNLSYGRISEYLTFVNHRKTFREYVILLIFSFPLAIVVGKILLAILKRATGNIEIVYKLPTLSLVLTVILWILFILMSRKRAMNFLLKYNIMLLLSLPLISFTAMAANYLNFFNIITLYTSTVSALGAIAFALTGLGLLYKKEIYKKYILALIFMHIIFSIFGIATILFNPSYNIVNASNNLSKYVNGKTVIGFLGHELSIENESKPIYYAPRLKFVSQVNSHYQRYNPEILLVTEIFDGKYVDASAWPEQTDIPESLVIIDSIDLTRKFFSGRRDVKINVFRIVD